MDGLRDCFFELDNVGNEKIERLDELLVEQGVEILREPNPVLRCPSICDRRQGSIKPRNAGANWLRILVARKMKLNDIIILTAGDSESRIYIQSKDRISSTMVTENSRMESMIDSQNRG